MAQTNNYSTGPFRRDDYYLADSWNTKHRLTGDGALTPGMVDDVRNNGGYDALKETSTWNKADLARYNADSEQWAQDAGLTGKGLGFDSYYGSAGTATTAPKEYSWWEKLTGDAGNTAEEKFNAQRGMLGAGQLGLGIGQLGLGLASYLQQSDIYKKQGRLLDQQIASNQNTMANEAATKAATAGAWNVNGRG